ncbi:MAG: methyltransferase domain-containing protein [Candidatus Daviesbacteria bacterium]|nr:methyltransferase domain-containing protein [Candidatus Daviesbacteria bacterium]
MTQKYILTNYGYYKNIKTKKLPYDKGYIQKRNNTDVVFYKKRKDILRRDFQKKLLPIVIKAKEIFCEDLRILDIGCGDGVVLESLFDIGRTQKIKIKLYGIDPDNFAFKDIRVSAKLTKGVSEKMPYDDSFFHVVISSQMIEHLTEIQTDKTNKETLRILKMSGFYYIETPNPQSSLAKTKKSRWQMFLPDHLVLYPPNALAVLLKNVGFRDIKAGARYEKDEQINEIQDTFISRFPFAKNQHIARIGMFLFKIYIMVSNNGAITCVLARK